MVAINNSGGSGGDPTRGTGPDKDTVASGPGLEASPIAQSTEGADTNAPDPARGGCMKFGWGCLPLLGGLMFVPAGLFF